MQQDDIDDLFGFVAPTQDQLQNISTFASKGIELKAKIAVAKQYLEQLEGDLRVIEEVELPSAIMACGMRTFEMQDGSKIQIKPTFQGSLSKEDVDRRKAQLEWLEHNGGESLIKDTFEIQYSKGQFDQAKETRKILIQNDLPFEETESVHAGSLGAFIKEVISDGAVVPLEEFKWRYFMKADIKPPKR